MAYRHITSCIPVGQQQSKVERMIAFGLPVGAVAAVLGAIISGGIGAAAGFSSTVGLSFILGFCDWWFHYRLICIEDDQCAVGTVGRTAVSTAIDDPDRDFTINLVLAPIDKDSHLNAQAQLSKLAVNNHVRYFTHLAGYPDLKGVDDITTEKEGSTAARTTALHCEIEGNGMVTMCAVTTAAAVVGTVTGTAAGVAAGSAIAAGCAATGPLAILCLLLAVIVALIVAAATSAAATGAGWLVGWLLGGDNGSPADVAAEPGSGTIERGDHIAIVGDWIFDNAHDGWHELHPVKKVLRIPCPDRRSVPGVDPEAPDSEWSRAAIEAACLSYLSSNAARICRMLKEGSDPAVIVDQHKPENNPEYHPHLG